VSECEQYRVIAKAVVNVATKEPLTAGSPREAADLACDGIDWYRLFDNAHRNRPTGLGIEWTDFGEEFVLFVVDPIGPDGQPDTDNAVWLNPDGTPWLPEDRPGLIATRLVIAVPGEPRCPECRSRRVTLKGRQLVEIHETWCDGHPFADREGAAGNEWVGQVEATCDDCGQSWEILPTRQLLLENKAAKAQIALTQDRVDHVADSLARIILAAWALESSSIDPGADMEDIVLEVIVPLAKEALGSLGADQPRLCSGCREAILPGQKRAECAAGCGQVLCGFCAIAAPRCPECEARRDGEEVQT
jgi:hypothetical protein